MSLEGLLTGGDKKNGKKKVPANLTKKSYKRIYLSQDAIELLSDIKYTKEQQGDYNFTYGDAVLEGMKLLAKKIKVSKAPKGYK